MALQLEVAWHWPLLQLCPFAHALHVAPPAPQVSAVRPVSQRLPLQQPWQLLALHVLPEHWLSLHGPFVHAVHDWPPLPHWLVALPGWQTPLAQQPPHVSGPHELAPPLPPPPPVLAPR